MADRHGFIVLYPEQQRANNANLCFNWFSPEDTRRGGGEAASIQAVVEGTIRDCGVDPERVFITGLSAGGAMTSVMLATCPELFAAGAIIAGLPYASARTIPEAFDRMRGQGLAPQPTATAAILTASGHTGPWPTVTVFHGTADHTVSAANADACLAQWLGVHDLEGVADRSDRIGPHTHRQWTDREGRVLIEDYRLQGMGHGVPIDPRGAEACGAAGPYMFDVGVGSTQRLAAAWGLSDPMQQDFRTAPPERISARTMTPSTLAPLSSGGSAVQMTIERALRQAGLLR